MTPAHRFATSLLAACLLSGVAIAADEPASTEALRLAQEAVIVDTHIDFPYLQLEEWADVSRPAPKRHFDLPRAKSGGLDVAFMSIYTSPDDDKSGKALQKAHLQIDAVEAVVQRNPESFALVRSPSDIERLRGTGKVLLALGMENGAPIEDKLERLAEFHARGVRYITLAHSHSNRLSDGSYEARHPWGGLSPFGEQVVAEMNRLGIMVDVSHLTDDAVRDVLRASRAPVIASHSGLRHFTPGFERNLSDELVRAIAKTGGVVQITFGTGFVSREAADDTMAYFRELGALRDRNAAATAAGRPPESEEAFDKAWKDAHPAPTVGIDAVLDQIDHAVKVAGVDHVGIGSDFDGVSALPLGLQSVADYPNLVAGLQARGYAEGDIRKILGGNLLRVWGVIEALSADRN